MRKSENFSADLDAAKKNPLNYFYALANGGRNFFAYEEFLLLGSFVLAQYDSVYVLNNNLFMEQYPIEAAFGDDTKKILLEHSTEPEEALDEPAEENLGSVAKLVELFVGLKACENFFRPARGNRLCKICSGNYFFDAGKNFCANSKLHGRQRKT